MGPLALLALAVGPALILMHGLYFADRYQKEPIRNLLRYLLSGAFLCVPAFFAETWAQALAGPESLTSPFDRPALFAASVFLGIALVEEVLKFGALRWLARRDQEIDEPFDWIVYAVTISLGFAALENALYVFTQGAAVGVARAFTAVPSHALNGTLMGDRLARAALAPDGAASRQRWLAIAEPTLWHGLYDALALGAASAASTERPVAAIALGLALLALLAAQWVLAILRVRSQQKISLALHLRGEAHRGGTRIPPVLLPMRRAGRP